MWKSVNQCEEDMTEHLELFKSLILHDWQYHQLHYAHNVLWNVNTVMVLVTHIRTETTTDPALRQDHRNILTTRLRPSELL